MPLLKHFAEIDFGRLVVEQPPLDDDVGRLGERGPDEPLLRPGPAADPLRADEVEHVDAALADGDERAGFVVRGDELALARLDAERHLVFAGRLRRVPQQRSAAIGRRCRCRPARCRRLPSCRSAFSQSSCTATRWLAKPGERSWPRTSVGASAKIDSLVTRSSIARSARSLPPDLPKVNV